MLSKHLMEYYKFSTKTEYKKNHKIFYVENCTPTMYDFGKMKWIRLPESYRSKKVNFFDCINLSRTTIVGFLEKRKYDRIENSQYCRKLTKNDKEMFDTFLESCSEEDKEVGEVNLEDPVVYGLIIDNKIVTAASLWHFGESLSDIGVLTHPNYRKKGYAEAVCKTLIENEDRIYVWRSEDNPPSKKLSNKLGFTDSGKISIISLE